MATPYPTEEMFLTSFKISFKNHKNVICDHCNIELNPLTAKVHMKRHYFDFLSVVCTMQKNSLVEDAEEVASMREIINFEECSEDDNYSTNEDTTSNEDLTTREYDTNISSLPPEILFLICRFLNLEENINLDLAICGSFVSNTGIKLYRKEKIENNRKSLEKKLIITRNLIKMYVCGTYKILDGNFTIREPMLVINSTNSEGVKIKTIDMYYSQKQKYLELIKSIFYAEIGLGIIDKWIHEKLQ